LCDTCIDGIQEIILAQNGVVTAGGVVVPGFSAQPLASKGHPDLLVVKAGSYTVSVIIFI
jgi:hypothetical protein